MSLDLTAEDEAKLAGEAGPGTALAMRVLVRTSEAMGAERLLDIVSAHVDGCLYHGQVSLDFAQRLLDGGASAVVPATLNVGSVDLLHPELVRLPAEQAAAGRRLMETYRQLGCQPTWTCAPYQLLHRPGLGDQIAWAESNAIVFANSVLGARTERYGDFIDICAAVTGRAPAVGLHLDAPRRATAALVLEGMEELLNRSAVYPLIGYVLGERADGGVVAIAGLAPDTSEDRLKAIGAAAATSGSVGMFHVVGRTPEAPTMSELEQLTTWRIGPSDLQEASRRLSTSTGGEVQAVALGTPHYSAAELQGVAELLDGSSSRIPLYINTARQVVESLPREVVETLTGAGVILVTDTCSYLTPILNPEVSVVMTDSAKWAYYAPANLGVEVVYGSMEACVEAALTGKARTLW